MKIYANFYTYNDDNIRELNRLNPNIIFNYNSEYVPLMYVNCFNKTIAKNSDSLTNSEIINNFYSSLTDFYSNFISTYTWCRTTAYYELEDSSYRYCIGTDPVYIANYKYTKAFYTLFRDHKHYSEPIYFLCTKRKYIRYIRQCILMQKEIDNRVLKLIVRDDFDIPRTSEKFRLLRPNYRKYVKKPILNEGIEIITMSLSEINKIVFSNNNLHFKSLNKASSFSELDAIKDKISNVANKYITNHKKLNDKIIKKYNNLLK